MHIAPTAVTTGGQTFGNIALGAQHVCAVASNGTMYCWGNNDSGQLADGTNATRTVPTALTDVTAGGVAVVSNVTYGVAGELFDLWVREPDL